MGLLDDLKQQADSLRQKQQSSQDVFNQNLLVAHTKLNEALHYWVELFNSINVIKPAVPRSYFIDTNNTMENLQQCDYNVNARRLTIDHREFIEAILLRFHCVSDQKLRIEKETDPLVHRLRDHLWGHNLRFDVKEVRNERGYVERGIFTVLCEVPVLITIDADLEKGQIRITAKNLEKLSEAVFTYDFDEFNKSILEELAKVIIGQPNAFRAMGRHQQAMRTTTTRPPRLEHEPEPEPPAAPGASEDPTKSFFGNIKSILKR